jgi:hypothetical protein
LKAFAGDELHGLRRGNLDFGAGRRIAADPCGLGTRRKRPEADQPNRAPFRHGSDNGADERIDRLARCGLAFAARRRDRIRSEPSANLSRIVIAGAIRIFGDSVPVRGPSGYEHGSI